MSLRTRILLAVLAMVLLPVLVLGWFGRGRMLQSLEQEQSARLQTTAEAAQDGLAAAGDRIGDRLSAVAQDIRGDNRLRLTLGQGPDQAREWIDYAPRMLGLTGLDFLRIQDAEGRILSSGHYREEYGRPDAGLAAGLRAQRPLAQEPVAVAAVRYPQGEEMVIARLDSLYLEGRALFLVGGFRVDASFLRGLAGAADGSVSILMTGRRVASSDSGLEELVRTKGPRALDDEHGRWAQETRRLASVGVTAGSIAGSMSARPRAGSETADSPAASVDSRPGAVLLVRSSLAPLQEARRAVDRRIGLTLLGLIGGLALLSFWISSRVSRPIRDLAREVSQSGLERIHLGFESRRRDEVGDLARVLEGMASRLRRNILELREAERRATLGEMARQVNHDIKNGLAPIRNALRHLQQVADEDPEGLAEVFQARRAMLDSAAGYLEALAGNYARISARFQPRACDPEAVLREAAEGLRGRPGLRVEVRTDPGLPHVLADPLALRRVLENLVRNAWDSLEDSGGRISLEARRSAGPDGSPGVSLVVRDDGPGVPEEIQDAIFRDFYTTRKDGVGLGLSIVRRLTSDFGGELRLRSAPGEGAEFTVWIPAQN